MASATLGALGVTTCLEHAWAGGLAEVGGLFLFLFLTAGMVLSSAQAVEQLNIKAKNFRDLLTDEPFSRQDIITLQVSVPSRCCFGGTTPRTLAWLPSGNLTSPPRLSGRLFATCLVAVPRLLLAMPHFLPSLCSVTWAFACATSSVCLSHLPLHCLCLLCQGPSSLPLAPSQHTSDPFVGLALLPL